MRTRSGFTLIELIVFTAIFSVAMAAFLGVFSSVSGVAVRQGNVAEVQSQSQFLLQTIQHYVEGSSLVDMTVDSPQSTLTLWMPDDTTSPTTISLSNGKVQLSKGGAAAQDLSSSKVTVSDLAFTRRSNPRGKDSVSVSFTVTYATGNTAQRFAQALQTAVSRVSAATFDSDVVPDTASTYQLGTSAEQWRGINNTVFFSGSNVGIGTASPSQKLQVNGNIKSNGDLYLSNSANGLMLNDGDSCWRITVSGAGALVVTAATCI